MADRYVNKDTAPLYKTATENGKLLELLWGDGVSIVADAGNGRLQVRARGHEGFVNATDVGEESLLELYFIDVGQGDGVLIRTPDDRHIMIDGGYKRSAQPTGKNAADFVDWKFFKDYRRNDIHLDAMISSHCDADHYGGLWDLINPHETTELDITNVQVDTFYHAGVGWWREPGHERWLGPVENGTGADAERRFLTRLIEDLQSIKNATDTSQTGPKLQGDWGAFLKTVADRDIPTLRLSNRSAYLTGFEPDNGDVTMRVLGPVEFQHNGAPALPALGGDTASGRSQNTNGNSVLLRLDYGRCRILLTGDLNERSQRVLLESYTGERLEFACDVAKACHHGSDDCSYEFLSTLSAAATVISSGDNESHAHPRPSIVAASALTGHQRMEDDKLVTPLVYSTEIARSIRIGRITQITAPDGVQLTPDSDAEIEYAETGAGDLRPSSRTRPLQGAYVVGGVIYGLVNVRTDGQKILCATLNEKDLKWDVKTFESRF